MPSTARSRTLAATLAALLFSALIPGGAAAATRPITFELSMGDDCLSGRVSDDAGVKVVWRDASRALKGKATIEADDFGFWFHCFGVSSPDPDHALASGHRVKVEVGSASRVFVVPRLTVAPRRVSDVFTGRAPAGTRIRLSYGAPFGDTLTNVNLEVSENGRWTHDPGHDIVGGHFGSVRWRSPRQDVVYAFGQAAYLAVTLGRSRVTGATRPGRVIEVALVDGVTGEDRAIGHALGDPWGGFRGHFEDQAGRVVVLPGDHLSALSLASDAEWIVPRIDVSVNAATDVVRGRCFDTGTFARFVAITVLAEGTNESGHAIASTEPDGAFRIDFGSGEPAIGFDPANIRSGDAISVSCRQTSGDVAIKRRVAG